MAIYEHSTTDNTKTQTYVPLNDGSLYPVPEGADPQTVRRIQNQILANRKAKANGTKKPSSRSSTPHRNSSRVNYAELAIAGAMLETVTRVNDPEPDLIFVNGNEMTRAEFFGEVC